VKKLALFELTRKDAMFCPAGQASFAETSEPMSRVLLRCRKEKMAQPLIDLTGLCKFPPGIADSAGNNRGMAL
jgi:hypothetical protein